MLVKVSLKILKAEKGTPRASVGASIHFAAAKRTSNPSILTAFSFAMLVAGAEGGHCSWSVRLVCTRIWGAQAHFWAAKSPGRPQQVDTVAFSLLQQIFNMSVPVAQCLQIQVTIPFKMDRS